METDFPDSRKISETILFLSDCWEVSNRYEHVDVTGFPIRFDNLLKHRIHGTKIGVLEVRGSTSSKQNQISAIGLMSRSLVGIDHILTLSGRLNTRERKMLSDLSLPHFRKIGIQDKSGSIKWLGQKSRNTKITRRDRTKLIKEIILMTQDHECRVTELVYNCNLNYAKAIEILDELIKKNYIAILYEDGHKKFRATKDGREYLKRMQSTEY